MEPLLDIDLNIFNEAIFDLLDRVDEAAFAKKRRLTVPFIREFEKEQD